MPPRKIKTVEKQPTLEEVTDQPVKVVTSTKTEHATTSKRQKTTGGTDAKQQESKNDLFLKRRAKKTGVAEDPAPKTQHEAEPQKDKAIGSEAGIWINRAPTLTLWVSIVARQQGYSKEAGYSPLMALRLRSCPQNLASLSSLCRKISIYYCITHVSHVAYEHSSICQPMNISVWRRPYFWQDHSGHSGPQQGPVDWDIRRP